jgi:hypothetical protein
MVPPLFVQCANGDLLMFGSADALIRHIESPDVESEEYLCGSDAGGMRFLLELEKPTQRHTILGIEVIGLSTVVARPTNLPFRQV